MTYEIRIEIEAQNYLDRLDNSVKVPITKKIFRLRESPNSQGKLVKTYIREIRHEKWRIYYRVIAGEVYIEKIEGRVIVSKIGDKKSQQKDIDSL
jgi:phage-related protein